MSDSQDENASLDEIRQLLPELPGPDMDAGTTALQHQTKLTKPAGSLGRLEELAVWLATWQGRGRPSMDRPRVAVFAGNHGITEHGVSAYPASVTEQMVQNFINGGAAVNQLAGNVGADLRVYEMALDQPTGDFTQGPAMNEEDCALALSYGMMSVEEGFDVMAVGEMGIGNTTAAAALCCALFGGEPSNWVGSGTGVDEAGLTRKAEVVTAGLAANEAEMTDPFEILRCLGGLELAAIAGAILACRMGRIPVVLDGFACTAAAAVLHAADSRTLDHCIVGHQSVEPGHARLLEILGKKPLMDLGMRLGEASGATLGIQVLQSAVACHIGMATFEEAGVSGPVGS
ncbi:nicotinate-nucleotide--dimethylbenzimidazole phosphoribosyltransferase [Fodinicurvata sediminis]|uniref:nicotinate-nucleotide--dimethylbenzimidazole phosphoribosyltransferase n=1 Tax=Fodinicurvata sediminis TaxID=1121832 RepID=UPI0003B415BE|nr:nicotinate-nucleotide--dimethylbenzimidazole phosphoribosyltransferase [Fodinicurvata sediminis]